MQTSQTTRYSVGDRLVKTIFLQFHDATNPEHIANRIVALDELFSTNIKYNKDGLDKMIAILIEKKDDLLNIATKDITDISEIVNDITNKYKALIGRHCHSFVTKYLFWHVFAMKNANINGTTYDDKFFIFDNIVANQINFKKKGNDFYKRWYDACSGRKNKLNISNNREFDLHFWNIGKAK